MLDNIAILCILAGIAGIVCALVPAIGVGGWALTLGVILLVVGIVLFVLFGDSRWRYRR